MPNQQIHTRSDEIQDIIGQIPSWIIRWGMTAIAVVICILIFCSFYIRFPDTLLAEAFISAQEQPFKVSWFKDGPQEHVIYVKEGELVEVGDTLLVEKNLVDQSIIPLVSATRGNVAFQKGTADNPLKSVITVYPPILKMYTKLYLPSTSIGKVEEGQRVLIKLDAYPVEDFGMLEGVITALGETPLNDKYQAEVRLSRGLVTTEGKKIPQQYVLTGKTEVILRDKSIFSRVFSGIFSNV
uniref:HlyD family efflux transporter periplasmic adaptor subunit n=1 Tax=Roseihalotalea indica TaxID=2867963 RepID=A0AA49GKT4_9BACT|nr:HlyD family efflux transporter periplasmic adaptor subunit [Tunicatimonas sp. TK19036]